MLKFCIKWLISGPECSPTERLIFEKLTGYEPFGVTSTLLFRGDSSTPGITAECVRRCQTLSDCRSFVLDHQRFECSSVQVTPSIHPADFRSSIGKTFFGGLCVPGEYNKNSKGNKIMFGFVMEII